MQVIIPTFPFCRCLLMWSHSAGPWILSFILHKDTIWTGSGLNTSDRHPKGIATAFWFIFCTYRS
jgi:hypothetical protein